MAAPHVSGAAALLMAYRELIGKPRQIKDILCRTATDLGRESTFQGHGLVDILRATQSPMVRGGGTHLTFALEALNAKHGDALILHYGEESKRQWILIDGVLRGCTGKCCAPAWTRSAKSLSRNRFPSAW